MLINKGGWAINIHKQILLMILQKNIMHKCTAGEKETVEK